MSEPYTKMLPGISNLNRPYWEGLRRHVLTLPECDDCGLIWYAPSPWCPKCHSRNFKWIELTGKGIVNAWSELQGTHATLLGAPTDGLPDNAVEITLEEGPRLISNLVGVEPGEIRTGIPVTVVFDDVAEDLTLARFKPA